MSDVPMTRTDAIAIRVRQLNGHVVDQAQLEEALRVIAATHQPLTDSEVNERRRLLGKKERRPKPERKPRAKKGTEGLSIPVLTKEDPATVAQALRPWTLLKDDTRLEKPEGYPWPRIPCEGVDIDAVHKGRG